MGGRGRQTEWAGGRKQKTKNTSRGPRGPGGDTHRVSRSTISRSTARRFGSFTHYQGLCFNVYAPFTRTALTPSPARCLHALTPPPNYCLHTSPCVQRGVRGGAPAGCGAEPREFLGVFFSPISTDFGHILELYHQSVQKDAVLLAISSNLYDSLMTASRRLLVATTLR